MKSLLLDGHVLARLLLGLTTLAWAVCAVSIEQTLTGVMVLVLLVWMLNGGVRLWRLLLLLRWFLVPALLVHALFTPGELWWPGIPVSKEGLMQGVRVSLHLVLLFLAAMWMTALLRRGEWLGLVAAIPPIRRYVAPYLLLLPAMYREIRMLLTELGNRWRLQGRWPHFPVLLLSAMRQGLRTGRSVAAALWLNWPSRGIPYAGRRRCSMPVTVIVLMMAGMEAAMIARWLT